MSLPAVCQSCGLEFVSEFFSTFGATAVHLSNSTVVCPKCGAQARLVNGTYNFIDGAISTFQKGSVSKADLLIVQRILRNVQSGNKDISEAFVELEQLDNAFAQLLKTANENSGAISVLLGLIGLFLAHYYFSEEKSSSLSASKREAVHQEQMLEVSERQASSVEKILELLEQTPEVRRMRENELETSALEKVPAPRLKPRGASQNRKERRKAKALANKNRNN